LFRIRLSVCDLHRKLDYAFLVSETGRTCRTKEKLIIIRDCEIKHPKTCEPGFADLFLTISSKWTRTSIAFGSVSPLQRFVNNNNYSFCWKPKPTRLLKVLMKHFTNIAIRSDLYYERFFTSLSVRIIVVERTRIYSSHMMLMMNQVFWRNSLRIQCLFVVVFRVQILINSQFRQYFFLIC
jgi:hypothetical protein